MLFMLTPCGELIILNAYFITFSALISYLVSFNKYNPYKKSSLWSSLNFKCQVVLNQGV